MEDELEDDFEEDRSLNNDFDEHADDMEELEDLTPEEVEDREAILDDREGRLAGPIVRCGRWILYMKCPLYRGFLLTRSANLHVTVKRNTLNEK